MTSFWNLTLLTLVGISVFVLISSEASAGIVDDDDKKAVGLTGFEKKNHDLAKRDADDDSGAELADDAGKPPKKKKDKKKKKKPTIIAVNPVIGSATTEAPEAQEKSKSTSTKTTTTTTPTPRTSGHQQHKSTQKPGHGKSTIKESGHDGSTTSTTTGKPKHRDSATETPGADHDGTTTTKAPDHDVSSTSTSTTKPSDQDESSTSTTKAPRTTTKKPDCGKQGRKCSPLDEKMESDQKFIEKMIKVKADEKALLAKAQESIRDWVSFLESNGKKSLNSGKARMLFLDVQTIRRRYFTRGRRTRPFQPREDGMGRGRRHFRK